VLPRSFFSRDTRVVARELLGMQLVRILPDGARLSGIIVETEAYRPDDPASHSFRGRTGRNAAMFMQPGTAYVYRIYGVHNCLNVVTEPDGTGAAVLIRALQPVKGLDVMRANRRAAGREIAERDLCRGPGRLCQALQVDLSFTGCDMPRRGSVLFVADAKPIPDEHVRTSARVGVVGGSQAQSVEWRWFVAGSPYVSNGPPRKR
jgi:DNA-3-methyladenine glycosylase